jgi:hypothetical protein
VTLDPGSTGDCHHSGPGGEKRVLMLALSTRRRGPVVFSAACQGNSYMEFFERHFRINCTAPLCRRLGLSRRRPIS